MGFFRQPLPERAPQRRLGLIHVYTGDGKGKTTAAIGLAIRAVGQDLRVCIIQFLKGQKESGELKALDRFQPQLELIQFGVPASSSLGDPTPMDQFLCTEALAYARRRMTDDRPDVLILDEINVALHHGLVGVNDVLDFLDNKHRYTEVVLTGRNAPPSLLNAADIVTVMTGTKHPYAAEDFVPRWGIEH